jgi:GT2 family glycosyltransferase
MGVEGCDTRDRISLRPPRVAIVVVSWNGREDTLTCLRSLQGIHWPAVRTIVVDNASDDGTAEAVADAFPEVEIVRVSGNLGFSGGNNRGIDRALAWDADWVFVLNNDTTVAPDVIARMLEAAVAPAIGVLAPLIIFSDPPERVWYAGARFDPCLGRSGTMLHYRQPIPPGLSEPRATDRATGAAMMVSRRAIEQCGRFDESLFFLYEDVDWSLRLRQAGYEIIFVPRARVWHTVAASQGGREVTPLTSYYGIRNNLEVCRRHAPLGLVGEVRRELVCLLVHLWGSRRAERPLRCLRAVMTGWSDFRRGHLGSAPAGL